MGDQAADTARTVVGKVNDTARAVVDKGKEVVGKVNDTARVAVDRVTDVVCNVSDALNGSACANATEANETMANGTEMAADAIPGPCCKAMNAQCMSCAAGVSEEEYCKLNPDFDGCGEGSRRLRKLLDDATEIVEDVASDLLPNTTTTNSTGPEVDMSPLNDLEIDAPLSPKT